MALNNTVEAMRAYRDDRMNRHLADTPEENRAAERDRLLAMGELELIFFLGLSIGIPNQEAVQQALQDGQFAADIGVGVLVLPGEVVQPVEVVEQDDVAGVGGGNGQPGGAQVPQTNQLLPH